MLTKWQPMMMMMMMISAKIGKNCVEPRNTISRTTSQCHRDVATSGVLIVEELCEAYGSTRSVEEKNKEDKKEQHMVPSFAETYKGLETVKAFFYAHSVTDADHEHILGLEKSYFQLRQNSAKKQKTMYDFFVKKVVFRISRFPAFIDRFLHSLEKR
jgi:arginine decarboxylase-like protein